MPKLQLSSIHTEFDRVNRDSVRSGIKFPLKPFSKNTVCDSYHSEQTGVRARSSRAGGAGTCQAW